MSAKAKLDAVINEAQTKALEIYIEAARDVLRRCSSLQCLVAAMGSAFWCDRDGEPMDRDAVPATAGRFLDDIDDPYYEAFRSPGIQVHRDKIVTDW